MIERHKCTFTVDMLYIVRTPYEHLFQCRRCGWLTQWFRWKRRAFRVAHIEKGRDTR